MSEIFKTVDYKGSRYEVGNLGTIYKDGKLATPIETPDGYLQVSCRDGGTVKTHRLVAMCFVDGRTEERNEVNHKDFNRKNNAAENLEWMTHAENIRYSSLYGKRKDICGEKNPNYGNKALSEFYKNNPDVSKEKQSRPGARNGRATPVEIYQDGKLVHTCAFLGECCLYMNEHFGWNTDAETFRCGVRRSKKDNRPYKGFIFKT